VDAAIEATLFAGEAAPLLGFRQRELALDEVDSEPREDPELLPRLLEDIEEPVVVDPVAELACDTDSEYTLLASVECESPL
jgi:hypothetical protein